MKARDSNDRATVPPGVILAGDLSRIAFPEIVSLITHTRSSGVLEVRGSSVTRTIAFAEGEVRGASSTRIGERLGDVMVRLGQLKRDQLEDLLSEAQETRPAGRLAVEQGLLTESGLWRAVQEHVTAVFEAILLEDGGYFALLDACVRDALTLPGLSAEGLLMEGVRRIDEMRRGDGSRGNQSIDAVLDSHDKAFRDIFATSIEAGAGEELFDAARSILSDDPVHSEIFGELRLSPDGELPRDELGKRIDTLVRSRGTTPEALVNDSFSTLTLFLLFVAGEHLERDVHRALLGRVKALVSSGSER